ncbi:hypothetical protein BDW66DRAFT_164227 [Aspergillus desertorum]
MSQLNEGYCPFCIAPAVENCYGEHLLDPATMPASPELAEALYISISDRITFSPLSLDEGRSKNDETIYLGGLTEPQFRAEMDEVFQFAETIPSFYQSLAQELGSGAAETETAHGVRQLAVYITPQRKRSKSDPCLTPAANENYLAQVTEIQVRTWQALKEIERAKNTLRLSRAQHDLWDEAIALGRERVMVYEEKKMRGTLKIKLATEFLSRLGEFNMRVQIGLRKGTFDG